MASTISPEPSSPRMPKDFRPRDVLGWCATPRDATLIGYLLNGHKPADFDLEPALRDLEAHGLVTVDEADDKWSITPLGRLRLHEFDSWEFAVSQVFEISRFAGWFAVGTVLEGNVMIGDRCRIVGAGGDGEVLAIEFIRTSSAEHVTLRVNFPVEAGNVLVGIDPQIGDRPQPPVVRPVDSDDDVLAQFLGVLHQDFDLTHETADAAIEAAIGNCPVDELWQVDRALRELLFDDPDETVMSERIGRLCDYHPPGDGLTYRSWVSHVGDRVRERIIHRREELRLRMVALRPIDGDSCFAEFERRAGGARIIATCRVDRRDDLDTVALDPDVFADCVVESAQDIQQFVRAIVSFCDAAAGGASLA